MSNLRELVSFAISRGDLSQNDREETSADVIGALARCDPLGAALWRVVGQHDVGAFRRAIGLLAAKLQSKFPTLLEPVLGRLCFKSIEEWLSVPCPLCLGRCFTVSDTGARATCRDCKGSGRGVHTAENRMKHLRVGYRQYAGLVTVFDHAHVVLNGCDGRVNRQLSYQLERRTPAKPQKRK